MNLQLSLQWISNGHTAENYSLLRLYTMANGDQTFKLIWTNNCQDYEDQWDEKIVIAGSSFEKICTFLWWNEEKISFSFKYINNPVFYHGHKKRVGFCWGVFGRRRALKLTFKRCDFYANRNYDFECEPKSKCRSDWGQWQSKTVQQTRKRPDKVIDCLTLWLSGHCTIRWQQWPDARYT